MKVINKIILVVLLCLNKYVDDTNGSCVLHLDKDFGNPSPVLLRKGDFLTPDYKGLVTLKSKEKITAGCPGTNRYLVLGNDTTDFDAVEIQCKSNKTFVVGRWEGQFKNITCNGQPWTSSEPAGRCYGGINSLHRVGFKIQSKFYPLYEACLNDDLVATTYVKHQLLPSAKYTQVHGNRATFIEGGLFGKVQVDKLYKNKKQRERLVTVLGEGMDTEYITKKQFLSRGHLAPQADFSLSAVRRATFHYVNTAPQWFRGNAGDWAALEEGLRRRAYTQNSTLDVYTGTLGVLNLKNKDGRDTPLYLADDENNNGIVPVPMYFFKLVYDPRRRLSTGFVTINSQFYNKTTNDRLTFCDDICGDKELPGCAGGTTERTASAVITSSLRRK
ncbi:DNA/RNA non-specific endonuclease domain-containing protein [Phthorimaea operculella]|nr:DNA/RNA non-specific endonuclease domain-containing protein [Phthorimaea operculella]